MMDEQLRAKAADWNVAIEETRETPWSLIAFGVRDGQRVVLKITKDATDEERSGEVLTAFGTEGVVRVYEAELGAVLLERLEPGGGGVGVGGEEAGWFCVGGVGGGGCWVFWGGEGKKGGQRKPPTPPPRLKS